MSALCQWVARWQIVIQTVYSDKYLRGFIFCVCENRVITKGSWPDSCPVFTVEKYCINVARHSSSHTVGSRNMDNNRAYPAENICSVHDDEQVSFSLVLQTVVVIVATIFLYCGSQNRIWNWKSVLMHTAVTLWNMIIGMCHNIVMFTLQLTESRGNFFGCFYPCVVM